MSYEEWLNRTWVKAKYAGNDGWLTVEHCPDCGGRILYNGNYYCEHWGWTKKGIRTRYGGSCNWSLPHDVERNEVEQALFDRLCGKDAPWRRKKD
jgi:hypothetical protein